MSFKRKVFFVMLSILTVFACVFGIVGCKNNNREDEPGNSDHTFAEGWTGDNDYHWHSSTDGSDAVSGKALHDWQLVTDESVAATCSAKGTNVYKCSVCEDTKQETTAQLTHVWSESVQTANPTCTEAGRKYKICSNAGCDATSTVEFIPATGHTEKASATCTQPSVCSVCKVVVSPALGHDYRAISTVAATCSADGIKHYACSHDGCKEGYDETFETRLPHNIVWEDEGAKEYKHTADLCYTITYTGHCMNEGCEHTESKTTDVTSHVYTTAIATAATCSADGSKTLTCKACEYHTTESYRDVNAHTWNSGTVDESGITTFTCVHNGAHTKQSVVSINTSSSFSADTIKSAGEVTLADTSIKLDDGVKNALPAGDVTLGAEKIDDLGQLDGVYLNGADEALIGGNTIFNLTLNAGGQNISDLGGTVSVTVPYVLSADEDPNNIIIFYINGDELEEVSGTYSNGFVTFETTHFSYYTVTKMTPAERCEKFGHTYRTYHQEPTCLLAGYDMHFCTRCGINEKEDIAALGHNWAGTKTDATCTVNGKIDYECNRCHEKYNITIPAYGHVWEATAYSAANCTTAGHATYKCELCEETYSTTTPQTSHTLVSTRVEATCMESGYTHNECIICGLVNDTDHVAAKGHTATTKVVEATCTVSGFTLTYCSVCNAEIRKSDIVAAKGHNMVNGVCSVCGHGCSHNYVAGETVTAGCETEGYTVYTCSKCNASYKKDIVNARGHQYNVDECTVCHKTNPAMHDYYLNLIETAMVGSVSVTFKDFSYGGKTITYLGDEIANTESAGKIEQIDVVKLTLTLSADGEIIGAGEAAVKIDLGEGNGVASLKCNLVVKDGNIYIVVDSDNQDAISSMYLYVEFDYMFGEISGGMLDYEAVKEYLLWYNGKVSPIFNKLISTNDEMVVSVLKFLLNHAFVSEANADGYTYTLDFTAVEKLNEVLYTTSVKKVVESLLGEGIYAKLPAFVTSVLNLTPSQALALVQKYGLDKKQVCSAVDAFMLLFKGVEFNSEKWLDSFLSQKVTEAGTLTYNDVTVAELIIAYTKQEATKAEFIAAIVEKVTTILDVYKDKSVYEVIADVISNMPSDRPSAPDDNPPDVKPMSDEAAPADMLYGMVKEYIAEYLPKMKDGVGLSFSTDKAGHITSAKISADLKDLVVFEGDFGNTQRVEGVCDVSGEVEFKFGTNATIDGKIIEAVNAARPKFERNSVITAYANKNLRVKYDDNYPEFITSSYGEEMRVHTDVRGNIIKIVVTSEEVNRYISHVSGNYIYCYENVSASVEEYDFTGGTAMIVSKNYCGSTDMYEIIGMCTAYTEYTSRTKVVHKRTQVVISDQIDNQDRRDSVTSYNGKPFYYNTATKVYTANNPHSLENLVLNEGKSNIVCGGYYCYECKDCGYSSNKSIYHLDEEYYRNQEYELADGAKSCEDGVVVKSICRECHEVVHSYTTYGSHMTYLKEIIDCSEYSHSNCRHSIYLYGCVCGEYLHTRWGGYGDWNYGEESYGVGFDSIRLRGRYYYNVDGRTKYVRVYSCVVVGKNEEDTCGFNFAYYTDTTKDASCNATLKENLLFNVTIDEEKGVVTGGTAYNRTLPYRYGIDHDLNPIEIKTEDGYTVEYKCADCGFVERRTQTTWTYNEDDQIVSETAITIYYEGTALSSGIHSIEKRVEEWTYNPDGSYATNSVEYQSFNEKNELENIDKSEYIFVQGVRFGISYYHAYEFMDEEGNHVDEPRRWSLEEYDYRNGYCSPMITQSTQSGVSPERLGYVNHYTEGDYVSLPTCTQLGVRLCKFCHEEVQDTDYYFEGHHYEHGICIMCGLENRNEMNGRVVFEDLSYTSEDEYVIGYYNREGEGYSFQISLINLNVNEEDADYEYILWDIYYHDSNEGIDEKNYYISGKVTFSVNEIAAFATQYGLRNYMIRVYFVSEYYGSTLDYSITIDAHEWQEGTLSYSYYDYEQDEDVEVTLFVKYCTVCGIVYDFGYIDFEFVEENEGLYYYNGFDYKTGLGCMLIVSAPIESSEFSAD